MLKTITKKEIKKVIKKHNPPLWMLNIGGKSEPEPESTIFRERTDGNLCAALTATIVQKRSFSFLMDEDKILTKIEFLGCDMDNETIAISIWNCNQTTGEPTTMIEEYSITDSSGWLSVDVNNISLTKNIRYAIAFGYVDSDIGIYAAGTGVGDNDLLWYYNGSEWLESSYYGLNHKLWGY